MQEGGMKGKEEGERPVRNNGVAAFISLWICMWVRRDRERGRKGWRDGFRERGRAPYMMGE